MPETDAFMDEYIRRYSERNVEGVTELCLAPFLAKGEHAAFTTVRWNALDADGNVLRDTRTTYHLLATPDGWRLLSYTNHF